LFRWNESTPEEKEEMIQRIADEIQKFGLEVPAILLLDMMKPLGTILSNFGRFSFGLFMPLIGHGGETFIDLFESEEDVEKLLQLIEKSTKKKEK